MFLLNKLLEYCFIIISVLKGNRTFTLVHHPFNEDDYLSVDFQECILKVYCIKKQYKSNYNKWYIPVDTYSIYTVYSDISPLATESLKKACELKIDIPAILPEFINSKAHKIAVTHAYLDLIIDRLKELNAGQTI